MTVGALALPLLVQAADNCTGFNVSSQYIQCLSLDGPTPDEWMPSAIHWDKKEQADFSLLLLSGTDAGQDWGRAHISGVSNPQFPVNTDKWVQETIVQNGEQLTVRMTAATIEDGTANFALRNDQATGTSAYSLPPAAAQNGVCGSTHSRVVTGPPAIDATLCSEGALSNYGFTGTAWTWKCQGSNGGAQASCQAPKGQTVTPSAGSNGNISPATPQLVVMYSRPSFTVTPASGYSATVGGTCGGLLSGNTYTTNPITEDCTVSVSFTANAAQDGACGSADGQMTLTPPPLGSLCSTGIWGSYAYTGTAWTWSCQGSNGGAQASCQAPKAPTVPVPPAVSAPRRATARFWCSGARWLATAAARSPATP